MPIYPIARESSTSMTRLNIPLDKALVQDILNYLECPSKAPTLRYLNRLIYAYIRTVPWESVSRIVKRYTTPKTEDCPRWPEEFWQDALQFGFGGTCFESSLAFYSLLLALGYDGYLTVNDMGDSRGCHAAIVILLGGNKYLVDITIPVHAALRIDPYKTVKRKTAMFDYTLRPVAEDKYEVERSLRPTKNLFTLNDIPISLPDYQAIVVDDYTETTGRFLNSVVMVKVIDDKAWRFFSDTLPYKLESFDRSERSELFLPSKTMAKSLAVLFHIPVDKISHAFSRVQISKPAREVVHDGLQERSDLHA